MYNKEGWLRLEGVRFRWFFVGFRWFLVFRRYSRTRLYIQLK